MSASVGSCSSLGVDPLEDGVSDEPASLQVTVLPQICLDRVPLLVAFPGDAIGAAVKRGGAMAVAPSLVDDGQPEHQNAVEMRFAATPDADHDVAQPGGGTVGVAVDEVDERRVVPERVGVDELPVFQDGQRLGDQGAGGRGVAERPDTTGFAA